MLKVLLRNQKGQQLKILNLLLGFICFFVLPGLIIFRGIDGIIDIEASARKQQAEQKKQELLDQLEFFSENDRFAHFILRSLCSELDNATDPQNKLKSEIRKLKNSFPGAFTFIVADKAGNLLPTISDETSYSYMYRQAVELLSNVSDAFKRNKEYAAIPDFSTRFNRLKPLLGDLIKPDHLTMPLHKNRYGRSLLASGNKNRFHLWHGHGGNLKLLVYISRDFIRGDTGLRWITSRLNRSNSETIAGFSSYPPDQNSFIPVLAKELAAKVTMALASHEEMNIAPEESDNAWQAISCRFLNQYWRGFALFRHNTQTDPAVIKAAFTATVVKYLFVLCFVLFVYQLKHPFSMTVKLKISAFFAFAVILPILVIFTQTMEYVRQTETEMMNDLKNEACHAIEKLDGNYEWFLKKRANALTSYLIANIEHHPETLQQKESLRRFFDNLIPVANPGEVMITDKHGTDYLLGISRRITRDRAPMCSAASNALKTLISGYIADKGPTTSIFDMLFYTGIYEHQNDISYFGIGDFEMGNYYRLLQPKGKCRDAMLLSVVSWRLHELQRDHIENYCLHDLAENGDLQIAAYCRTGEDLFLAPNTSQPRLINLLKMSVNRKITQVDRLSLNGKEHIAVAMPGRQLNRMILAAFLPLEKVKKQREIIINRAKALVLSLCLLAMATLYLLRKWLFRPLHELKTGIDAIAKRDFHKRLEIVCHNEFGELMTAFNHSLETLQELEVARIVQESLLPENALTSNRCQIVAKTRIMTNLGGDYYDMIPLGSSKVLLFIGDATGHGIPAALSMAMAKSILIHENHLGLTAEKLMQQVNQVFGNLRRHGSKDYMTALCIELDSTSGSGRAINAGHCYPIIFRQNTGETRILSEINALPPGFDAKIHYQASEFMLQPGDRLFLFTDGFVECQDKSGQQIGFDGLAKIISATAGQTSDSHIANIFQRLESLSAQLQDDCTMIVLSFQ